jgi:type II secretory pathway pseudopilin PulG
MLLGRGGRRGRRPPGLPRGRDLTDESGLGLIEVMIAILLLAVGLMAVASVGFSSLRAMSDSQSRQIATAMATESLEVARSHRYATLAMNTSDPGVPAQFDHESGTAEAPGTGEDVIATPSGSVTGAIHARTEGSFELNTFVTQPEDHGTRRVTAIVAYAGPGGAAREVRFTTLIAEASRGLGQPDFDVGPPARTLEVPRDVGEVCFQHTLQNRGARDRYLIEPPVAADHPSDTWPSPLVTSIRVYDPDDPTVYEVLTTGPFAMPVDPDTYVETGDGLTFDVCYGIPTDYDEEPSRFATSVVVSSDFRADQEQVLSHVTEVERQRNLYLYPEVDEQGALLSPQTWDGQSSFGMLRRSPSETGALPSYGPGAAAGLELAPADGDPDDLEWVRFRNDLGQARNVTDASVRLWLREGGQAAEPRLWVRLERHAADGSVALLGERYLHDQGGVLPMTSWQLHVFDFDLGLGPNETRALADDDELVLSVGCRQAPDETVEVEDDVFETVSVPTSSCRLAFGTQTYPAHVKLGFP